METLTSAEVARLFSIKHNSVRTTLARRGVRPLHREPGREGQNVYAADAVRAALPTLAVVADAAAAPEFTLVPDRSGTVTEVALVHHCSGLPTMTWVRGEFTPKTIRTRFIHRHDHTGWQTDITVHGTRVLKSGADGADDAQQYFMVGHSELPEWLAAFVAGITPTWNPGNAVPDDDYDVDQLDRTLDVAVGMGLVEVVTDDDADDVEAPAGYLRVVAPGEPGAKMATYDHPLNTTAEAEWRAAFAAQTPFVLRATDYGVDPGTPLAVRLLDFRYDLLDFRIVVAEEGNGLVTGMIAIRTE